MPEDVQCPQLDIQEAAQVQQPTVAGDTLLRPKAKQIFHSIKDQGTLVGHLGPLELQGF